MGDQIPVTKKGQVAMCLALETICAVQFGATSRQYGAQLCHLSPWSSFEWEGLNAKFPITELHSYGELSEEALRKRLESRRMTRKNYRVANRDSHLKDVKERG